jgi:hypothetical protein
MEFDMEKKNPLLAGLFNMLVPGAGHWYVDQDRQRFVRTLFLGFLAIAAIVVVGTRLQKTTGFPLPQGLCTGILLLIVLVPLFLNGQKVAHHHNFLIDGANLYNARQEGSSEAQLARNQTLRDKGLISEQEYDSRRDGLTSKK